MEGAKKALCVLRLVKTFRLIETFVSVRLNFS